MRIFLVLLALVLFANAQSEDSIASVLSDLELSPEEQKQFDQIASLTDGVTPLEEKLANVGNDSFDDFSSLESEIASEDFSPQSLDEQTELFGASEDSLAGTSEVFDTAESLSAMYLSEKKVGALPVILIPLFAFLKTAAIAAFKLALVGGTKAFIMLKAVSLKVAALKGVIATKAFLYGKLVAAKTAITAKLATMKTAIASLGAKIAATKWYSAAKIWLGAKYAAAQALMAKLTATKIAVIASLKATVIAIVGQARYDGAVKFWESTAGIREIAAAVGAIAKWGDRIKQTLLWITGANKKCGTNSGQEQCRANDMKAHAAQIKTWSADAGQTAGRWVQKKICKNVKVFHWFRWKTEQRCHYKKEWVTGSY